MATEEDVASIARSLPETTAGQWYGAPAYNVHGKGFLRLRQDPDRGLVIFVADLEEKEALLAADPQKFFTTAHYDGYPAVLVRLPAVEVDELRELIIDSWLACAPVRLRNAYLSAESNLPGDTT